MAVDAFKLAMVQSSLIAIAREMKVMTMRTAYTQLWKEQGDLSCCIMDAQGDILAQDPTGFPIHVTTMPYQLKGMIEAMGAEAIEPGVVLMTNDPFIGGTHLPDVLIARPLFWEGELYAWACNRGHWADIGGMGPGSYSPATPEIFQEGQIIPPVRLFVKDKLNTDVLNLVVANVRNRAIALGDMRAQYASCFTAERRLAGLVRRYGLATVRQAMLEILDRSEALTRARLKTFPDGVYHARDQMDGDGLKDDPVWFDVKITIEDSSVTVDLSDSSQQSTGGMNCSRSSAISAVQFAFKSMTDPENPPNAGSYRPIEVITRPGTVVDAQAPAAIVGFGDVTYRVLDTTWQALAQAVPELAIASGSGSTGTVVLGGRQERKARREYFTTLELSSGAYGARASKDGMNAIRYGPGNAGSVPIEADEMENPLIFERFEILPDTGGAGKFRGGNGFCRVIRLLTDKAQMCLCADRHRSRPQGLFGGGEGTSARYVVDYGGAEERKVSSKTEYFPLREGAVVWLQSAGGGGYGNPKERDRQRVQNDLDDGYITAETAEKAYGLKP